MKWHSLTGTGLTVAAVGLAVACGGGGDGKPPREITADDLALMVLQREDVPAKFRQLLGEREGRGLRQNGEAGALASYSTDFELPPEEVEPGETICITSAAALYETAEDTKDAFREIEEFEASFEEEGEEFAIERVSLPSLGNQSIGVRFFSPHAVFCSIYENEPTEAHLIVFRIWNVVGSLIVLVDERGASLEEAIELAQTQANRIEAIFEGDD